ncbi:hypothetical protein BCR34DRAFT_452873, partial [Clohesyomyces aquaticus]
SSLAFSIARRRSTPNKPIKPPGKNWARNRHEKFIYNKITEWFEVIKKVLQDPTVLSENAVGLGQGRDDLRNYKGAKFSVERTMVTTVECISADGR